MSERDALLQWFEESTVDNKAIQTEMFLRDMYKAIEKLRILDSIEETRWRYAQAFGTPGDFHLVGENYQFTDEEVSKTVFGYHDLLSKQRQEVLTEIDSLLEKLKDSIPLLYFLLNIDNIAQVVKRKGSSVTVTGGDKSAKKKSEDASSNTK